MNLVVYLPLILILVWILYERGQERQLMARQVIRSKKKGAAVQMLKLAEKFIGQECIIYTLGSQLTGTIREVSDDALLVQTKDSLEAVNLDFVVRIREYPRNKQGKRKSVVTD